VKTDDTVLTPRKLDWFVELSKAPTQTTKMLWVMMNKLQANLSVCSFVSGTRICTQIQNFFSFKVFELDETRTFNNPFCSLLSLQYLRWVKDWFRV
jgi:hypothetical protein